MKGRNVACLLICFFWGAVTVWGQGDAKSTPRKAIRRIVIDAGHGGADVGARGKYSTESEICLAISLRLEKMMKEALPDVEVFMTRTTDVYDDVRRKAEIANQAKGDLFLCIHANAAPPIRHKEFIGYKTETYYKGKGKKKKKMTRKIKDYRYWTEPNPAKGTETFIYPVDKTEGRINALTKNEDGSLIDSASLSMIQELEKSDPAKMMLLRMRAQTYFQRSADLALTIEDEFKKVGRISREAKQRKEGIFVLYAVAMPAVLVETGFISNPEEEDYLNSEAGQTEICEVLIQALKRYKFSLEKQQSGTGSR